MVKLKRSLSLWKVTISGIGIILGAGIYALIGKAAFLAGNAMWISFLIAALVAVFSGLSFAELSSMFPKSSAEYIYTKKAFGLKFAFLIGWLAIFGGIISSSTVASGFGGYFSSIFNTSIIVPAIILLLIICYLLFKGINFSTNIAVVFTLIEAAGLIMIIFIGLPKFDMVNINYFDMPSLSGLFTSAALIFFAYMGFEDIVRLSEETKKPKTNIPRAIIYSVIFTTIIYVLVAISAVSVMSPEALGVSNAPLSDVAQTALGDNASLILAIIALFATANTSLLLLLSTSRIIYGMSKSKSLPNIFSKVHKINRTPWVSIIIICLISISFFFINDILLVANLTNFTLFFIFIVINLSLIVLRYTKPNLKRPFKVPFNFGKFPIIPFFGILVCLFLLFSMPIKIILYGFLLIIIGLIFSFIF